MKGLLSGSIVIVLVGTILACSTGCGDNNSGGAAGHDTVAGDVPSTGQTPGQGRIDRGGGTTAGGSLPDSTTNYTEPSTGLAQPPK